MDKLIFEAKCRRCNSINLIDYIERFNGGVGSTKESADYFIMKYTADSFIVNCPKCGIKTVHEVVTLIKEDNG